MVLRPFPALNDPYHLLQEHAEAGGEPNQQCFAASRRPVAVQWNPAPAAKEDHLAPKSPPVVDSGPKRGLPEIFNIGPTV